MAKKSSIVKNEKRFEKAKKFLSIRRSLRKASINMKLSEEERTQAFLKLQKLPKSTCLNRVVRRCNLTGRPRGHLRHFGLSRIAVRELAHKGHLPGVTKASW